MNINQRFSAYKQESCNVVMNNWKEMKEIFGWIIGKSFSITARLETCFE